jgi:DNA-directed RNA polymerase specialized sigma subunit
MRNFILISLIQTLIAFTSKQIHTFIYKKYNDWLIKKTLIFKKYHYNKCKHIPTEELIIYAYLGLQKAAYNYNSTISLSFTNYASYFVIGKLYKGMTDLQPITSTVKKERIKKVNPHLLQLYYQKPKIRYVGLDTWLYDKHIVETNNKIGKTQFLIKLLRDNINNHATPLEKQIFYYKYNPIIQNNNKKSNLSIALQMQCSEETIRKMIKYIIKKYLPCII